MLLSLVFALLAMPAFADNGDKLDATMKALKEHQTKADEISAKVTAVTSELEDLQRQSRKIVKEIRTQQSNISENRNKMKELEAKRKNKSSQLKQRRSEIAQLIHGMIRLQRLPHHYVVAQPGDMNTLLRSASALNISYRGIYQQLDVINAEFAQLAALEAQLKSSQLDLSKSLKTVELQQKELTNALKDRRQLQQSLRVDHKRVKARVAKLSKDSENLQQLIAKLETETLLFKNIGMPTRKPSEPEKANMPLIMHKGGLAYPAHGKLLASFGDKRDDGEKLEGIELLTAPKAPVTAPHGGRVVFSGEFMDYGPMVIIEHDKTYHSVIAGLDLVEVEPGDPIRAGAIIGVMGKSTIARKLYFELRKNSKPIDPSDWMGNVSKIASRN